MVSAYILTHLDLWGRGSHTEVTRGKCLLVVQGQQRSKSKVAPSPILFSLAAPLVFTNMSEP